MEQSQSAGMWWMQPSERAVVLDRTSLSKDAWRIETWYANNGFFDASVKGWDVITVREGNPEKGKPKVVRVVGIVEEGKQATIRSIKWKGLKKTGGAFIDLIRKKAAVKPDEPFNIDAVRETEGMLLNQLHDMSFGFATVTTKVDAYPEEGVVDLTVHAKTGPACRFGPITVTGDYDIPEAFVRSEVTIKEGRAFRASTLAETQRRLFALGVFSMVNVVPDPQPSFGEDHPHSARALREQLSPGQGRRWIECREWQARRTRSRSFSTSMSSTDCGISRPSFVPATRGLVT